jgi:ABC-type antimicrobial peptide transport system ATPase subunit
MLKNRVGFIMVTFRGIVGLVVSRNNVALTWEREKWRKKNKRELIHKLHVHEWVSRFCTYP